MRKTNILKNPTIADTLKRAPLVEVVGQNRALIENHMGVLAYSLEKILIKVDYGKIEVDGQKLQIQQLSGEQLVITGHICGLQLLGR